MNKATRRHTKTRPATTAAAPARIAPDYAAMLAEAVSAPGTVAASYSMFHNYSLGNQILAALQLAERGLPLSPIASYRRWQELGRQVRKGEKAICLYMPVTCRARRADNDAEALTDAGNDATDGNAKAGAERGNGATFTRFVMRPNWFALAQTDGADAPPVAETPEWDAARALAVLQIEEEEFSDLNGNKGGYAHGRTVAVSPLSPLPHRTRFHELAHVQLGHTTDGGRISDTETLTKCGREVEAEAVAYLCLASLSLPGLAESRGYLQAYLGDNEIDPRVIARIFKAADQILKAGSPAKANDAEATDEPEARAA